MTASTANASLVFSRFATPGSREERRRVDGTRRKFKRDPMQNLRFPVFSLRLLHDLHSDTFLLTAEPLLSKALPCDFSW